MIGSRWLAIAGGWRMEIETKRKVNMILCVRFNKIKISYFLALKMYNYSESTEVEPLNY